MGSAEALLHRPHVSSPQEVVEDTTFVNPFSDCLLLCLCCLAESPEGQVHSKENDRVTSCTNAISGLSIRSSHDHGDKECEISQGKT